MQNHLYRRTVSNLTLGATLPSHAFCLCFAFVMRPRYAWWFSNKEVKNLLLLLCLHNKRIVKSCIFNHHTITWQSVCTCESQGGKPIGKALVKTKRQKAWDDGVAASGIFIIKKSLDYKKKLALFMLSPMYHFDKSWFCLHRIIL